MFFTGAAFAKRNSCIVARIDSFDTIGLHLLTFHILMLYTSKDVEFDLSRDLRSCFQVSQLPKYYGSMIT